MKKWIGLAIASVTLGVACCAGAAQGTDLRPPAVPLVVCDPYLSVWSPSDKLADADTTHWTGRPHRLNSLVQIDGKSYRLMGIEPATAPALEQKKLTVLPTRTIYEFEGAGVAITLTFMTPALPDDLDLLSRPVTYLTWECRATDGKTHRVAPYLEASAELAVNDPKQKVAWDAGQTRRVGDLEVLKVGSQAQRVLGMKGDDLRIDWGHLYLAAPTSEAALGSIVGDRTAYYERGEIALHAASNPAVDAGKILVTMRWMPKALDAQPISFHAILAYDDIYSIQYFHQNLRPYWRRGGWEAADLLKASDKEYEPLKKRCSDFDAELMADLTKAGGGPYAKICALAYRQTWAGCKLAADANGQPLVFPKENHSNGCIATVDVIYPMAPQFLLFGPSLTKAILIQNLDYASSPRWKFPFAPHDLGTYPKANGQVYGGGERTEDNQMPVEETGNMLILLAALAQMEGNADFASKYWPVVERWAAYLKEKGFDPDNQLCTDDFAGHLAHNVNLSAKAICGLASFARLCEMRGGKTSSAEYMKLAKEYAARWVKEADDGDHFRLAFDKPGSWSQKYNCVWDRILGFDLWPSALLAREMAFYRRTQSAYGLPLDNRKPYTKLDWTLWTATLTQDRADFEALAAPVYRFLNETPNRSPMTDWYMASDARKKGFTARPVVGGVFLQLLYDKPLWRKWAGRERVKAANWTPLPKPPATTLLLPTAREDANIRWRYTMQQPAGDWFKPGFDASAWQEGAAGFGTTKRPNTTVRTGWTTADIWLRREFELPDVPTAELMLLMHHDDNAEVYINGVLAADAPDTLLDYERVEITPEARATLRPGKNSIAVHCHQAGGGQFIDVGLVRVVPAP